MTDETPILSDETVVVPETQYFIRDGNEFIVVNGIEVQL